MNRLGAERSPYLLQHKDNPVDWYAWGDDAFARARSEDKPIFLSIGYSTCHWCHVMERESFENAAVAAVLNEHFISIKVDREERPDVDRVYMTFVQATTGSGGWPMSVWLTPDLKPFYGGTYFPPESRWGRPGFTEILGEIARVWRDRTRQGSAVGRNAHRPSAFARADRRDSDGAGRIGADANGEAVQGRLRSSARRLRRGAEVSAAIRVVVPAEGARARRRTTGSDTAAKDMVLRTLRAMALGGMRDHIGGGFHRYSVDAAWRVPHFEKMLYDQAQLVLAFVEGAQVSGDPFYAEVAEDTLRYVMREMTDARGGFYSAEDADSVPPEHASDASAHKAEGAFYLWRADEVDALLGEDASVVKRRFGIEPNGNAPVDPQQEFTGKNLLYVAQSIDDIARHTGKAADDIVEILERARMKMFEARLQRPRPHRDDKVLTAWNGLMIAAFARMARTLRALGPDGATVAQPYLEAARRAAAFIQSTMWDAASGGCCADIAAGTPRSTASRRITRI